MTTFRLFFRADSTPKFAPQIELEYPMSLWAGFISVPFKDIIRINKRGLPHNQVKKKKRKK